MKRTPEYLQSLLYWWERRSLQSRLLLAYIFIILVPSLIVSVVSFNSLNETYIKDAMNKNTNLLEMEKLQIMNQIESMERSAQLAKLDKDVENYLTNENEQQTRELVEFNMNAFRNLTRIQFNNPNIEHLRLFSASEYVHEIWPIIFSEDRINQEPWYKHTFGLEEQQMWYFQDYDLDLMNSSIPENTPKISLFREISIIAGKHAGIIQVDMLLSNFSPRTFSDIHDDQSQLFLLDKDLQIFTRTNDSILLENTAMEQAIHDRFVTLQQAGTWDTHYEENGKSFLFLQVPIERTGAYLLNVVSMENVLKDISVIRNKTIGANVLFIALFTVIVYVLNSFILKNLVRLTEAMKKARRGELYTGITMSAGGEIGELAHHFNKLMYKINELVAVAVRKQALTKEAELRTLHNQIDSHFLYNTLENIKMLAEIDNNRQISDALTSLGGMMRYNFKWSGEYVKLKDEIRHIENYIAVMNIRFEDPISLIMDIEPSYMEVEVLKMSLQPIVENSVKHGWSDTIDEEESNGKKIHIVIETVKDDICISITDNGDGMGWEQLQELNRRIHTDDPHSAGIGLQNVHQRLQLFYGIRYGLEVTSEQGVYTKVLITFPRVLLTGGSTHEAYSADR
ncbi:sensor histidine kinase [Paenibacillus crassostreae]|uniref:Histidine kinase n=1 Tax=Paenibacillus crassostreae TaxID=1763538 RepID=A0A167BV60_9BACL|nr:sensor histidine kinase [Paenibacillus crassostreae]AOZ92528.1 sensor histidine kinase [Paenibacillus crassostreae]OAB72476.1 histidine kinase [Paenibacillus crassostreae]